MKDKIELYCELSHKLAMDHLIERFCFELEANRVIFNENDAEIYDLLCMMKCKNNIMSASTFSWWGAWLKDSNQNGIVVAPQGNYFNNKFLLDEWVKL